MIAITYWLAGVIPGLALGLILGYHLHRCKDHGAIKPRDWSGDE